VSASELKQADPSTQRLRQLVPHNVALECILIGDYCNYLYPKEYLHIASAVTKRKNEFSSGRLCARRALASLQISSCEIPAGPMREPMWPAGVTGSISHDGAYAVAAAAFSSNVSLIGIDITLRDPLDSTLVEMICTKEEIAYIGRLTNFAAEYDPFKLVFSLKEAIYKCLFPLARRVFDFSEVSVFVLPDSQKACILLNGSLFPQSVEASIQARYCFNGNYIFSVVWMT
jgi:4'-phosphopantetheinyl transferase EntD